MALPVDLPELWIFLKMHILYGFVRLCLSAIFSLMNASILHQMYVSFSGHQNLLITYHHQRQHQSRERERYRWVDKMDKGIHQTHYLQGCSFHIPKWENLSLAWEYAQNPVDLWMCCVFLHRCFRHSCVSLKIMLVSKMTQTTIRHQIQLAVTFYHMGCFGNGASLEYGSGGWDGGHGLLGGQTDLCYRRWFVFWGIGLS